MTGAPESEKVYGPTHDGEKICHIVTEEDPDTALCGKDVTGWPGTRRGRTASSASISRATT